MEPNVVRRYYSGSEANLTFDIDNEENEEQVYGLGSWEQGTGVGDPRKGLRFMVFNLLNREKLTR